MKQAQLFFLIIGLCQLSVAQNLPVEKLNEYFEVLDTNDKFMGTISIHKAGKSIYQKSVGFSNIETKTKANSNSIYAIGSISKSFTAVLIFQAIEKGQLSLDTKLSTYFPTLKNSEEITIDHLLSHRSGIPNYIKNNFSSWSSEAKSRAELIKIIENEGSEFAPNSQTNYSNSNYVLLSYILEIIHKKSFAEILDQQIVRPLHLKNTSLEKPKSNNLCYSYKFFDKWRVETNTAPENTLGAGGIWSTADNLNTFFQALSEGKLISKQNLELMIPPKNQPIGKGLMRFYFHEHMGYGHTGGIDGFHAVSIYLPQEKTAVSITANGLNYVLNNILINTLSAVFNKSFDIPDFKITEYSSEELDKYLGVYSTSQLPMKISITKKGTTLIAQATGQTAFELVGSAKHTFKFDAANIVLVFDPDKRTMTLKQGGGVFVMNKE